MSSSPSASGEVPHELADIGASCQSSDTNIPSNPVQVGKHQIPRGRRSVIQDYCRRAGEQGGDRCIWLCIKRGRETFATDMRLEDIKGHFGIHVLQKHHSWWKRHSFYSAVGVKIIKLQFLRFEESTNKIQVLVFDDPGEAAELRCQTKQAWNAINDPMACGVDSLGKRHDPALSCPNEGYDELMDGTYCKVIYASDLERQRDQIQLLPQMLEYLWQNDIDDKATALLNLSRLVHKYGYLEWDGYCNAISPYGKTINGLLLLEGWHVRYISCLVAASLVASICVIAVATAVSRSFEAGLTAGTYTLGLATIVLAILTFASAIV